MSQDKQLKQRKPVTVVIELDGRVVVDTVFTDPREANPYVSRWLHGATKRGKVCTVRIVEHETGKLRTRTNEEV